MTRISRYREAKGPEATAQPGSRGRVMLNRLGLASKRGLDQAEALALEQAQEEYYTRITVNTRFTAALLRQMHRVWLGGIYEWVGKYRTVELEKEGFHWPPSSEVIWKIMRHWHASLKRPSCVGAKAVEPSCASGA